MSAYSQALPPNLTAEQLANDNALFLRVARGALKWDEPAEPVRIVGPLYFVGTQGLGAFLFATDEGHVLMNTGMPESGPMIVDSIRKLGFDAADIEVMINGHAHVDHAGAFAYIKRQSDAEHHILEMLKPDIWLAQHNEYYDLVGKRERAETEGVDAWIDPEGYRRFVADKKRAFEDQVDRELGAPRADAP